MTSRPEPTLLLSIDGVAPRFVTPATMPNLIDLARRGGACWSATTVTPSLTLPAHASLLRGVGPDAHGLIDNTPKAPATAAPSLLAKARDAGRTTATVYPWTAMDSLLEPSATDERTVYDSGYDPADDARVVDRAATLLAERRFDLVFVYLVAADLAGHRSGWGSASYREALQQLDGQLGRLLDAAGAEANVVVTTDHGGTDTDHGAGGPLDLETFVAIGGPRVAGGSWWDGSSILDIAPTVCDLLGVEPHPEWQGRSMLGSQRPSLDVLNELLAEMAEHHYGESLDMAQHSLQTAALARSQGADDHQVLAALLHDVGHLIGDAGRWGLPDHAEVGARFLQQLLPPSVVEPIRLHVAAKQHLVASDPGYRGRLSEASIMTLAQQGGAFDAEQSARFLAEPYAEEALALRRRDDDGKVDGLTIAPIAEYQPLLAAALAGDERPGDATWIRDACRCHECRDTASGQHLLAAADLDGWFFDGGEPEIKAGHRTREVVVRRGDGSRHRCLLGPQTWDDPQWLSPPATWGADHRPEERAASYSEPDWADRLALELDLFGIAVLTDVPTRDRAVLDVAAALGHVRETNYGRLFDVLTKADANNLAYSSLGLPLHTDNPYRDPVPTVQLLHCLQPADEGGASRFSDGFRAVDRLQQIDERALAVLAEQPVRFHFGDDEVDLRAERSIVEFGPGGRLRAVSVNHRSMEPPEPGPTTEAFYRAYRRFCRLLESPDAIIELTLRAGDLVAFDNRRVLHARTAFATASTRHLQGCYIEIDAIRSAAAKLRSGSVPTRTTEPG